MPIFNRNRISPMEWAYRELPCGFIYHLIVNDNDYTQCQMWFLGCFAWLKESNLWFIVKRIYLTPSGGYIGSYPLRLSLNVEEYRLYWIPNMIVWMFCMTEGVKLVIHYRNTHIFNNKQICDLLGWSYKELPPMVYYLILKKYEYTHYQIWFLDNLHDWRGKVDDLL